MSDSERELLQRLGWNDGAAFKGLFLRYYGQVYRVLYRLVGNREEAEDLAQETFLALYRTPPRLDGDTALVAWLCRVALNRGYNALRGERRSQRRLERLAIPSVQDGPDVEVLRAEERARIRATLKRLPERQGKLLLLRHAGLSYAEIAAAASVR